MIQVSESCIGCLRCIPICPGTVLSERDGVVINNGRFCIGCLHCAAICPVHAITNDGKQVLLDVNLPPLPESLPDDLTNLLLRRRSYRRFQKRPVPQEIINNALHLANWAPSACNQHPVRWLLVESTSIKNQMMDIILAYCQETGQSPEIAELFKAGNNVVFGQNASVLLCYCQDRSVNPNADAAIALAHIELFFQAQGIGTCWAGYFSDLANKIPSLNSILRIPNGCSIYNAILFGWPDQEHYEGIPSRASKQEKILTL